MAYYRCSSGGSGVELNPSASYTLLSASATNTWLIDPSKHYIFVSMHQTTGVKGYCGYISGGVLTEVFNDTAYVTVQMQNNGTTLYVKNNSTSAKLGTMLIQLD